MTRLKSVWLEKLFQQQNGIHFCLSVTETVHVQSFSNNAVPDYGEDHVIIIKFICLEISHQLRCHVCVLFILKNLFSAGWEKLIKVMNAGDFIKIKKNKSKIQIQKYWIEEESESKISVLLKK